MTAATILAHAAWRDGKWCQKIPSYGGERRGAAVMAYLRLDDEPIRRTSAIYEPDCIIVLDEKLLKIANVVSGVKDSGIVILNDRNPPEQISLGKKIEKLAAVDATNIANQLFGFRPIPITNTIMLGAFSAATNMVTFESISEAIIEMLPKRVCEKNIEAAKIGYNDVKVKKF